VGVLDGLDVLTKDEMDLTEKSSQREDLKTLQLGIAWHSLADLKGWRNSSTDINGTFQSD
jgi:hypothetical protein